MTLSVDRLARLHLRLAAREPFEVRAFIQAPFESGRRNFQSVGSVNKVFHIQKPPHVTAHARAILVGHTLWRFNVYSNNALVLGAVNFGVYQLEAMVDCDSF